MEKARIARMREWPVVALSAMLVACGAESQRESSTRTQSHDESSASEIVRPPFSVRGEAEGLLLTWFDEEGTHVAQSRTEVPEARRAEVRVDSLSLSPEERDPDHVFVADLRAPSADGTYVVRRLAREEFDQLVDRHGDEASNEVVASAVAGEVVIFGASWCGACRQTEAYLRERGIPFVERDIEREPDARADMQRRAARAGVSPRGIPVIDFRGRIIQGFDREAIDRAIRETNDGAAAPGSPGVSI
jgi:glutaredoxin